MSLNPLLCAVLCTIFLGRSINGICTDSIISGQSIKISCQGIMDFKELPFLGDKNEDVVFIEADYGTVKDVPEKAFSSYKNLEQLSLINVGMHSIHRNTFASITKLKTLNLVNNRLNETGIIQIGGHQTLSHLTKLYMSINEIQKVSRDLLFNNHGELEYLTLRYNQITCVEKNSFEGLKNLKELSFWRNKLSEIHAEWFKDLKSLKSLILSENEIEFLPDGVFNNLKSLTELKIRGNRLKNLNQRVLYPLINLEKLDFAANFISSFDPKTLVQYVKKLNAIYFNYNLWSCEDVTNFYTILSVGEEISHTDMSLTNVNGVYCKDFELERYKEKLEIQKWTNIFDHYFYLIKSRSLQ